MGQQGTSEDVCDAKDREFSRVFVTPEVSEVNAHGELCGMIENDQGGLATVPERVCRDGSNPGSGAPASNSSCAEAPVQHGSSLAPRADSPPSSSRRRSARRVDQDRGSAAHSRDRRGESQPCCDDHREDRHADLDVKAQQGVPQEERASDLLRDGPGLDGGRLRHDRCDAKEGDLKDLGDLRASGVRANGVWETLPADLLRDVPLRPGLLRMGQDNAQRGRLLPSPGTFRSLAVHPRGHKGDAPVDTRPASQGPGNQSPGQDGDGKPGESNDLQLLEFPECRTGCSRSTSAPDGGHDQGLAGGDVSDPRRAAAEGDLQQGVGEASHGDPSPAEDVPGGTVPAGEPDDCCQMSSTAASALAYKSQSIIPRTFNELLGKERPRLLEVACSPNSVLSRTFQDKLGCEDCAVRCSFWNGADLTKPVGLQLVLEQIRSLNPLHVWLSPPCGPYSPMQHTNQRTAEQRAELQVKRQEAIKIYHSVREIVRVCVHLGIHCTVEMSERCEAWRLPVFQELAHQMGLQVAVVKGCSVGLKGRNDRLVQKGWKLVTTHKRLAQTMHKTCRCPTNYEHDKCEGEVATRSALYTSEFARLVFQALQEELSFWGVVQECRGESEVSEDFGRGEVCACGDAFLQKSGFQCGNCLLGRDATPHFESAENGVPYDVPAAFETHLTPPPTAPGETEAQELRKQPKMSYPQLETYLEKHAVSGHSSRRSLVDKEKGSYYTFGTYAFGNHYGLTARTLQRPQFVQMINAFIRQHFPADFQWTAFTLNANAATPLHKDLNNHEAYPNCCVGLGSYEGGEIWIEGISDSEGQVEARTSEKGEVISGGKKVIRHKPCMFSPKMWHQTCDWKGTRWVVTAYVTRGLQHLSRQELTRLRKLGFEIPQDRARDVSNSSSQKEHAMAVGDSEPARHNRRDDERIKKQLYLLHCASGHCSVSHMIDALKRRRAPERTIELAKEFKCPVCTERSKPPPRAQATLEPLPPKFCTISADVGHWEHPHKKEPVQFMLVIDEGSRFRVARVLTKGSKQQPSANACLSYLQEGWHQYFGHPRALRVDPAGSFRSFALIDQYCDKHGVFLDVIPGEAHWKNGVCEQAIQGVKELMSRLCSYDPELTSEGALAEAVTVFNHRDMVRGFSPAQHVLGRGADDTDRFVEAGQGLPPGLLIENPEGEFARAARRRAEAEKIHADWNARQRINRAANSRHRPCYNYLPGELVFFWRSQESGKGRRQPGTRQGRFLGPARILATETRKSESGELSPGGAVWLVRGRNLIKCAPEQLRRATEREEILEGMSAQAGQPTPWTFTQVAENLGGNQFQDATTDVPALQEWRRAQEATEASQPSRLRIRQKRPAPPMSGLDAGGDSEMRPEAEPEATPLQRPRLEPQGQESGLRGECWWSTVSEQAWPDVPAAYWSDQQAAVEVEVAIPETQRGILRMTRNFEGYFVGQMKRKAVEVSERRLSPEEQAEFRGAKQVEVKNFLSADAFEALPKHLQPSRDQAVGMRWVLTWKLKDDGTRKAKARAVLLGYQDPCYEHRSTTAPVMTRQSRQMLLQMAAWKRWRVRKGDVSGAFLQGREYPDTLYCIPTPEICEAMNLPENSVTKIKRACYGLVDAPLEWYRTVDAFLQSIGMERCSSDACMWCYREQGELKGLISGHVDDFIFGGDDSHQGWCDRLKQIQEKFRWGDWETDKFTQCGVLIEATPQGFSLSQPSYLEGISEIGVNATRRKDKQAGTSERERTQLRALLGGLSWHAQQVAPHLSADVSLLLSEVSHSTVDTIIRANILLQHAKARAQHKMIIHGFTPGAELGLVAWVDAAAQSRVDGGSTQGIVIGMVPRNLLHGEMCEVSLMSWHSSKIDRTCRSPGASEALAAINGEDNLYYARFQWSELLYGNLDLRRPDLTVRKTFGCLVTDSRNVYDKMNNEVIVVKGAEKRTSIELLGLKEAQRRTDVIIRWVHSEAQLANSLTKTNGLKELEMFYRMGHRWRIVEDEQMQSARRRRELGLLPLSQTEGVSKDSNHSNDSEVPN